MPAPPMTTESALITYFKGAAVVLPAALATFFATCFLTPKLEQIWRTIGMTPSGAAVVLELTRWFANYWWMLAAGAAVLIAVLELKMSFWPRYRAGVVLSAGVLLNAAAFVGVLALAVLAILANGALASRL